MAAETIRITKVGGRYLIFEVKDVAALRRDHCICAVFIGTMPQNPNQSVFSGLPLELLAEEAKLLVERGAAYVVDDAAAHLDQLTAMRDGNTEARVAYLQSLRTRRRVFEKYADSKAAETKKIGERLRVESLAKKAAKAKAKNKAAQDDNRPVNVTPTGPTAMEHNTSKMENMSLSVSDAADNDTSLFSSAPFSQGTRAENQHLDTTKLHMTPSASTDLFPTTQMSAHMVSAITSPRGYPLYRHLNSKGFYMTPGIRFGADYSVYPGDPFRYHAHFMATSYGWNEEITVLDLVAGGRLGTGVKKGFLIGGEGPPHQGKEEDTVRTFTIEWAAM